MLRMSLPVPLVAVCLLTLGCQDSPEPLAPDRLVAQQVVPQACTPELVLDRIVRVRPDSPPLETLQLTILAVSDQDQRLEFRFDGQGGRDTHTWFARLRLGPKTLLQNEVHIEARVDTEADGTVLYSLHLEPDVTFNPERPARIEFHFSQADTEDLSEIERLRIFRQEVDGGPYVCVPSGLDVLGSTMQADVNGFTRYALAIGR